VGTLNVLAGAELKSGFANIGVDSSADNQVTVDNALWNATQIVLGGYYGGVPTWRGKGTLNIQQGGTVNADSVFISDHSESIGTVKVTGANSLLNVSGIVQVGSRGTASMTVESGGRLQCADLYVGYLGPGEMTVQGGGTVLAAGAVLAWAPGAR